MATPSVEAFKKRIPAFSSVADETIEMYLFDAQREVVGWNPDNAELGTYYLAAHRMTVMGLGTSPEAQFGPFKRLKISGLELERATNANEPLAGTLLSTTYGRLYSELGASSFSSIFVV